MSMKDNPYRPCNETGFNEIHISKTRVGQHFFLSRIERLKHHDKLYVLFFRGEQPDHVQERLLLSTLQRDRSQVDTSKDLCYQTDMFFFWSRKTQKS